MSIINEDICQTLYSLIYHNAINSYEKIISEYPNLKDDIKTNTYIQNMHIENPELTEKELIAHAYANILVVFLVFGRLIDI
jgi:hypothetical protein